MPVVNIKETPWKGFLIEGLVGSEQLLLKNLQTSLAAKELPKVSTKESTVNMWYRPDCPILDITSSLDGTYQCTIHLMHYGANLFVGVAHTGNPGNYYKQMAAACFLTEVHSCVSEAIKATAAELGREVIIKPLA